MERKELDRQPDRDGLARTLVVAMVGLGLVVGSLLLVWLLLLWRSDTRFVIQVQIPSGYSGHVIVNIPPGAPSGSAMPSIRSHAVRVPVTLSSGGSGQEAVGTWPEAEFPDTWVASEAVEPDGIVLSQMVAGDPSNAPNKRAIWVLGMQPTRGGSIEYFVGTEGELKTYQASLPVHPYLNQFIPVVPVEPEGR